MHLSNTPLEMDTISQTAVSQKTKQNEHVFEHNGRPKGIKPTDVSSLFYTAQLEKLKLYVAFNTFIISP